MKRILPLLTLFFNLALFAQTPEEAITAFSKKYPQEKVVVTLCKSSFIAGETIFFSAYALNGYAPSLTATNLYTELYDGNHKLLDKGIIPLFNGSGEGSFLLPASIAEDVYFIRAYTHYSLNFENDFQCISPVPVYNTASGKRLQQKKPDCNLSVVPEGGNILPGDVCKLGVRVVSATVLPQSWQADLYEAANGELITTATIYNREAGIINFIAEAGKTYTVKARDNTGTTKEVVLPVVKDEGASLQLSINENKIAYQVITKNLPANGAGYKLVATLYDEVVFSATIKNSSGAVTGLIDTKNMPGGVIHFTLFNPANEPLNERLGFIHPALKKTVPDLYTDTLSFAKKGYNSWSVRGDSMTPSYTLQVSAGEDDNDNDFFAGIYLTSDFTTPIHQARDYVGNVTPESTAALDALLITEHWKRFNWEAVMKQQPVTLPFQPENYLTYTGTVHKGKALQPLKDIMLIFREKADSSTQFLQVKTDSSGRFTISEAIFLDTVKIYYQSASRKFLEKDIAIEMESKNKFYPCTAPYPATGFETVVRQPGDPVPGFIQRALEQRANEMLQKEKTQMMEEILVKTTIRNRKQELDDKYSSPLFSGGNATVFDFVNEDQSGAQGYSNILLWLRGRVSGLVVNTQNGHTEVQIRGSRSLLGSSAAQIYVDEIPVDADYLNGLPIATIAMVKVLKTSNQATGSNGAVLIYTKRGGEGMNTQTIAMATNFIVGYKQQTPPFAPDYSISTFTESPDQREILYRARLAIIDANAPPLIRFYNNDNAKKFRVLLTGFNAEGQPVYLNKVLE